MTTCSTCARLDEAKDAILGGAPAPDPDGPTRWWHCGRCGAHLVRYRGQGDQTCGCGAWYNAFGQRLRDDWTDNPAWGDSDLDDLEGFEQQSLRREAGRG
ncbi:MAG: hypothetical protein LCH96_16975 [Actinobacteria bacterium]|nr:hypothetical protein [Actinomycetota bacterium]